MSRHRSYGKAGPTERQRTVLKRFERIEVLQRLGKWEGKRATHLPKTPPTA